MTSLQLQTPAMISPSFESQPKFLEHLRKRFREWNLIESSKPTLVFHCSPIAGEPELFAPLFRRFPDARHYYLPRLECKPEQVQTFPHELGYFWEPCKYPGFQRLRQIPLTREEEQRIPRTPKWNPKAFYRVEDLLEIPWKVLRTIIFPFNNPYNLEHLLEYADESESNWVKIKRKVVPWQPEYYPGYLTGVQVLERCPLEKSFIAYIGGLPLKYVPRKHLRWWVGDGTMKDYEHRGIPYFKYMECTEPLKSHILNFLGCTYTERKLKWERPVTVRLDHRFIFRNLDTYASNSFEPKRLPPAQFEADEYWLDLGEDELAADLARTSMAQWSFYGSGYWTGKALWDEHLQSWVEGFESAGINRKYRWGSPLTRERLEPEEDIDPSFESFRIQDGRGVRSNPRVGNSDKVDSWTDFKPRRIRQKYQLKRPYNFEKACTRLFKHLEKIENLLSHQVKATEIFASYRDAVSGNPQEPYPAIPTDWSAHMWYQREFQGICDKARFDLREHLLPFFDEENAKLRGYGHAEFHPRWTLEKDQVLGLVDPQVEGDYLTDIWSMVLLQTLEAAQVPTMPEAEPWPESTVNPRLYGRFAQTVQLKPQKPRVPESRLRRIVAEIELTASRQLTSWDFFDEHGQERRNHELLGLMRERWPRFLQQLDYSEAEILERLKVG